MFSQDPLHVANSNREEKPKPHAHDMDVVTGPSGLKPNQQSDTNEHEGGGWQNGIMS